MLVLTNRLIREKCRKDFQRVSTRNKGVMAEGKRKEKIIEKQRKMAIQSIDREITFLQCELERIKQKI